MFSLANVMNFFSYEFSRLCRWRIFPPARPLELARWFVVQAYIYLIKV
jgi:hypothetical protein